ncbi:branched-chain amino acid aminotransferase [Natronobacillus azotifigens]|uniref:Branched-chain-amino-acid aminotransferase n=1 Tax=Natronobacillus azotifigens TaxID=472978 RepID=A0A9J6R8N4_9BACI|nr:branched-chain amino acid aminotransferase [Natronobacillus azotifigens]MCZ0701989.1 branched-chain amino acid aminotransferase [Natronobacillus azotifigens]
MTSTKITTTKVIAKKTKPATDQLEFGRHFTDHMFVMDYHTDKGWYDPRIVPYQAITLDPAAMVYHYGQTVFEGLKAYVTETNDVHLFRPEQNVKRLNRSNERMCIPEIDEELALRALKELVKLEKEWIPNAPGTSLYIRPFVIATEPYLGVAPSKQYKFVIILSPVGAYYKEGINPVKIAVENKYIRAIKGGTGEAKTAGNYAGSLIAQEKVSDAGYAQVLWLDGLEKKYIEEVGSMNVFFKINGEVITPALNGSILPGVTRNSVIQLLKHWNIPVKEEKIALEDIKIAYKNGSLEEAFGAGTAAVISPIGEFACEDETIVINNHQTGDLAKRLYDTLTGIQYGKIKDPFDWIVKLT